MITPEPFHAVRIERTYAAPIDRLWRALSEPEHLSQWMCAPAEEGTGGEPLTWEFRVGGAIRIPMKGSFGEIAEVGKFVEIEPPRRLVYTFQWENDVPHKLGETLVTITLSVVDAGHTRFQLEHRGFNSSEEVESHSWGWGIALDALKAFL